MKKRVATRIAMVIAMVAVAGAAFWWMARDTPRYLAADPSAFVQIFHAPPAPDSAQTRQELATLLELQRTRSAAAIESARGDRRKDVDRFYAALGIDPAAAPRLPALRGLTDDVEQDVSRYVRAAKLRFGRARPYVIEPALEPCIGDVQGDQSYPSGHATYGFVMAYLLADMVPERRSELLRRGAEYARQRMVCGVHFPSDLAAGRTGAAWLADEFLADPAYAADARTAAHELRAALRLPE